MAGCHNATTPYHTITPKGVGNVVIFSVGFSLGICVGYDWDLPSASYSYQIHFIHINGVGILLYVCAVRGNRTSLARNFARDLLCYSYVRSYEALAQILFLF
jgi:hypothetical protein